MLWYQGATNIGLSNRKLKSALKCTVWSQNSPVPGRETDGQTDGHTDGQALWQYRDDSFYERIGR